ncbi:unnamed protein product, partial [Mesorhabditis spiculigera]
MDDQDQEAAHVSVALQQLRSLGQESDVARATWELANKIETIDKPFDINVEEQRQIRAANPWEKDPHYFKEVKISAVALIKMVTHARSGGNLEVMGLMQGHVDANTFVVTESFALPEPWVAVVIDPLRTMSAGKVDIGAFRTYPKGYKPPEERGGANEYQSVPLHKIEDFGVHCKQYYSLDVTFFKSALDDKVLKSMFNTYWINSLRASPIFANSDYINAQLSDLAGKTKQIERHCQRPERNAKDVLEKVEKLVSDAQTVGEELQCGMLSMELKKNLFSRPLCRCREDAVAEEQMAE